MFYRPILVAPTLTHIFATFLCALLTSNHRWLAICRVSAPTPHDTRPTFGNCWKHCACSISREGLRLRVQEEGRESWIIWCVATDGGWREGACLYTNKKKWHTALYAIRVVTTVSPWEEERGQVSKEAGEVCHFSLSTRISYHFIFSIEYMILLSHNNTLLRRRSKQPGTHVLQQQRSLRGCRPAVQQPIWPPCSP